jgi:hypothetical protein
VSNVVTLPVTVMNGLVSMLSSPSKGINLMMFNVYR